MSSAGLRVVFYSWPGAPQQIEAFAQTYRGFAGVISSKVPATGYSENAHQWSTNCCWAF